MRSITIIFCVVLALFSFQQAQARIIHVPSEQSTIQAGINASVNGDTVLVAPGTYYERINFNGHKILLGSLFLTSGDISYIPTTIIDGSSAGIVVTVGSGEDNTTQVVGFSIQHGHGGDVGGGIFCDNSSSPTIKNNIFKENLAFDGGGIGCYHNCSPIIENNCIIGNTATNFGSGIHCQDGSSPLIVNNTLDRNVGGRCISCYANSSPQIKNNIITNTSSGWGIFAAANSSPVITYCDVWNNASGNFFGCAPGVGCISADPIFCDTASDNYYLWNLSPCVGAGEGGADIGALGVGCGQVLLFPGPSQSGYADTQVYIFLSIQSIEDSTDTFDLYVSDNLGWSIVPNYYEVVLDSGQVDTVVFAVSIPHTPLGTIDWVRLHGVSRTDSTVYGWAYLTVTCTGRTIRVPADFSGIQAAINFSSEGDSIIVAPGTYQEHIFFNGKSVVVKSEKGPDSTIISRLVGGVSMVYFVSGEDTNSVIDGFTITGGYLDPGQGAGIRCYNSSPKILNNKITSNSCPYGAGIDCDNYSSPLIAYNVLQGNTAFSQGGGIRCNNHSSPLVLENTIVANSAGESGAGLFCLDYSSPTITGNRITDNTAQNSGAGIYFNSNCSPTLTQNLAADNTAQTGYGGGIALYNYSNALISNNTFDRNSAPKGGGIYMNNTSSGTIVNTIVTNSLAGKGIRAEGPLPTVIYCDAWNNVDENYYGCLPGEGCISSNPLFCNPDDDNYSLWLASPCLGAGQNGADIGAYGQGCSPLVGDANADGRINMADVVYLINYLFVGGPAPAPLVAGDVNCDGKINASDVVYLINYLFIGGPASCEP